MFLLVCSLLAVLWMEVLLLEIKMVLLLLVM
jgi:hypothetical protein